MSEETKDNKQKGASFVYGVIEICLFIYKLIKEGFKTKFYRKKENLVLLSSFLLLTWVLVYKKQYLKLLWYLPDLIEYPLRLLISNIHQGYIYTFWTLIIVMSFIMITGLSGYKLIWRYQRALDHLNLKSGLGHRPVVVHVDSGDENRTKILVKSTGLGEERYKSKLDDLRSAAGQQIESVMYMDKNNCFVEISFAKKQLEQKVYLLELLPVLKRPFSFIVGKSQKGIITESLEDVPHYLIAGSTGGGKSTALKGMILSLLESSKRIQFYLFDFKEVELVDFKDLPNVAFITQINEASKYLEKIVKEMQSRYEHLSKQGEKKIHPDKDNKDLIVIAIDECSSILGKVAKNDPHSEAIQKAKNCLIDLSRKARAAGIHLIFATQKVDMLNIDTQIQENLEGRLSFRMNSIENSVRVLQNNKSYYLPSIRGRAIWKKGADYAEIQSPYFTDDELKTRISELTHKFEKRKFNMLNLKVDETESAKKNDFVQG